MRVLTILPIVAVLVSCGPGRLSRREAESDIRKDYPVQITVAVPESATAIKGSPDHAKLVGLAEAVGPKGIFTVARAPEGDRERFTFKPGPALPRTAHLTARGYELPAAEAEFVRALRLETRGSEARVTYQIRLVRPTDNFPLFQQLHPGVRPGETKERHASYRREGRNWMFQDTDETFKRAQ
jgi:hypothetical protein